MGSVKICRKQMTRTEQSTRVSVSRCQMMTGRLPRLLLVTPRAKVGPPKLFPASLILFEQLCFEQLCAPVIEPDVG